MAQDTITVVGKSSPLPVDCTETHHLKYTKQGSHNIRSLVVDDDNTILTYVSNMLVKLGFQKVETAQTKPEVMNRLTDGPYHLLITDLEMPDMNGYQLSDTIKKEAHDTKVIIMTGRPEKDCLEMITTGRVDGWIFKPFGFYDLRNMLGRLGVLNDNSPGTRAYHSDCD